LDFPPAYVNGRAPKSADKGITGCFERSLSAITEQARSRVFPIDPPLRSCRSTGGFVRAQFCPMRFADRGASAWRDALRRPAHRRKAVAVHKVRMKAAQKAISGRESW